MRENTDVKYDHELVKRMNVINFNAMQCLKMPVGFARFFNYFNMGNIGNASQVMNKTHAMRESFIYDVRRATTRVILWLYEYTKKQRNTVANDSSSSRSTTPGRTNDIRKKRKNCTNVIVDCTIDSFDKTLKTSGIIFAVNEMPVLCIDSVELSFFTTCQVNDGSTLYFWPFFLVLKYLEPGAVITVTQLHKHAQSSLPTTTTQASSWTGDRATYDCRVARTNFFVNIRLTNGVPTCPVNINVKYIATSKRRRVEKTDELHNRVNATTDIVATYCDVGLNYYANDSFTINFSHLCDFTNAQKNERYHTLENVSIVDRDQFQSLPKCHHHIWCSRHELILYELS